MTCRIYYGFNSLRSALRVIPVHRWVKQSIGQMWGEERMEEKAEKEEGRKEEAMKAGRMEGRKESLLLRTKQDQSNMCYFVP